MAWCGVGGKIVFPVLAPDIIVVQRITEGESDLSALFHVNGKAVWSKKLFTSFLRMAKDQSNYNIF